MAFGDHLAVAREAYDRHGLRARPTGKPLEDHAARSSRSALDVTLRFQRPEQVGDRPGARDPEVTRDLSHARLKRVLGEMVEQELPELPLDRCERRAWDVEELASVLVA